MALKISTQSKVFVTAAVESDLVTPTELLDLPVQLALPEYPDQPTAWETGQWLVIDGTPHAALLVDPDEYPNRDQGYELHVKVIGNPEEPVLPSGRVFFDGPTSGS